MRWSDLEDAYSFVSSSAPCGKFVGIRRPIHPAGRRCFSSAYARYDFVEAPWPAGDSTTSVLNELSARGTSPYGSACACVSRATGETWWHSDLADLDDENPLPEEAVWNDEYVWIPHKNDLDLGKALVLDFVAEEAPEKLEEVEVIFSRRGAYRHFENLLEDLGLLEEWSSFEERRTREALVSWAQEEGLPLEDSPGGEPSA